jgi:flagellar M-ring protein FliF
VQSELSNTIMEMDGVSAASVNITLPDDSPFVGSDEPKAKAAVLLDLGSAALSAERTQAIVHLVSSSVADLSPDAVTVTDTQGNVYAAPGADDALTSNQNLARTSAYETAMAGKLEDMLARSLGLGHATVVVTADMNFDKAKETSESVTPELDPTTNEPLSVASETKDEEFNGPGNGSTGILGLDGTPLAPGDETPISYRNTEERRESMFDRVTTETERAGGEVEKLGVAVMVDEKVVPGGTAALTELISTAAGIDTARGDTIAVQAVPFDEDVQKAVAAQLSGAGGARAQTQTLGLVRYVVTLLTVALVLFLAWRSVKRAQLAMGPLRVPLDLTELDAHGRPLAVANRAGELGAGLSEAISALPESPRALEPQRSPVEQEITDLIERQPDEVAQTLRSWLADRRA